MKREDSERLAIREDRLRERLSRRSSRGHRSRMLAAGARVYEVAGRGQATAHGGVGLIHDLVRATGLASRIDASVDVFQRKGPYSVSDHVLSLTYNVIAGERTLDELELRRQDAGYLDLLGAVRISDPTTAGDFLRRFERATIDIDGTIAPPHNEGRGGECKEGVDRADHGE